ncbi:MAG: response regulator, partial [Dehalococcoidia bacterium]|nr:response regulator [Dehalococcoidia bacterium]
EDLNIINKDAQRVANIVNRMLTFARQYKPQRTKVNINEVLSSTIELREYALKTDNIQLTTGLDPLLPATIADGSQLQQVFMNIIINAEAEMKLAHGKGSLLIKTEAKDDIIRITFHDDGPGISKENLGKIFNPFFTTREVGQGTGLGLSVCHGIIIEHGGRIYAKSEPGNGATFFIELPAAKESIRSEPASLDFEQEEISNAKKILVVDDEPTVRQFLSDFLSKEGYKIDTADNGTEALKKMKSKKFNLVLLDIKLPGMSGLDIYQKIEKTLPTLSDKVIFITGDVMGAETDYLFTNKKVPCITKPFDIEKLKQAIKEKLN